MIKLSQILFHGRFKYLLCSLTVILGLILYTAGVITLLYEIDFTEYTYPLEIENIKTLIDRIDRHHHDDINGQDLIVNYSSIVSTLNGFTDVRPLKQFENIDILIDLKQSCKQFWQHDFIRIDNNQVIIDNKNSNKDSSFRHRRGQDHDHSAALETGVTNVRKDGQHIVQPRYQIDDEPIRLLIVVKSAVNNYLRRQAIRKSWYINGNYEEFSIRTIFVVGGCHEDNYVPRELLNGAWSSNDCRRHIKVESERTGDIIQGSFVDMYYNNTLKTYTTMRWINDRCRQAEFILALDDDYLLETENLLNYIRNVTLIRHRNNDVLNNNDINNVSNIIVQHVSNHNMIKLLRDASNDYLWAGFVRFYTEPLRHMTSKWYLPYKDYPYNKFPPFISGGATLLSRKTMAHFYYASYFTKSFIFDDVYIGLIAYKLNIVATHNDQFMSSVEELLDNPLSNNSIRIAVHDIDPDRLVSLWEKRKRSSLNSSVEQEWSPSCLSMHYSC